MPKHYQLSEPQLIPTYMISSEILRPKNYHQGSHWTPELLNQLVKSIERSDGVMQDCVVAKLKGVSDYYMVCGFKRLEAVRKLYMMPGIPRRERFRSIRCRVLEFETFAEMKAECQTMMMCESSPYSKV